MPAAYICIYIFFNIFTYIYLLLFLIQTLIFLKQYIYIYIYFFLTRQLQNIKWNLETYICSNVKDCTGTSDSTHTSFFAIDKKDFTCKLDRERVEPNLFYICI